MRTYTGYADVHPVYANGNAYKDYDKDGILDRIYRTYRVESDGEEVVQVYCFLGNGNTIVLDDNLWGDTFSTYCFDFNEDEIRDICFVQQQNAQDGIRSGQLSMPQMEKHMKYFHFQGRYISAVLRKTRIGD